jgi:glycosyltransferase involved in cell wall biosynthesis
MNSTPGVTLLDANLTLEEMNNLYKKSDIFVLPTYRDSYGLVIQEALSWGMPIITTDQYAIGEMVKDSYNGFIFPRHPLKDYREESFKFLGKYYNPKDFYTDLFRAQKDCQLQEVEDFVYTSIEKFILDPSLLEKYSQNSVDFYNKKFHPDILSCQIESIFLEAVKK